MKRELADLLDRYLAAWCGVRRERLADRSLRLGELGVDGLALGEMMGDLERRFGLRIDDPSSLLAMTPAQVVDALYQRIPFRADSPRSGGAYHRGPATPRAPPMSPTAATEAAALLWRHWTDRTRLDALPPACRPADRRDGYAVQAALARCSGQPVVGWKIAATSAAGQAHIGVDGPLAGRLLRERVLAPGARVSLEGNAMRVAEVEFAFRMARALPPRDAPYGVGETLDAVASLHPSVEVPDSRYVDFVHAGVAQLIADHACACWLVLGEATRDDWRVRDLAAHPVRAWIGGRVVAEGTGAAALGDPRIALAWIANELRVHGPGLAAGDVVTTGTCVVPVAVAPGDAFVADYGPIGSLALSFA